MASIDERDVHVMDGSGVKRLRLLEPQGSPDVIECDGMDYYPVDLQRLLSLAGWLEGCHLAAGQGIIYGQDCGRAAASIREAVAACPKP